MSGGSSGGGFGGGRPEELNCDIVERISLASPDAQIIAKLKPSDELEIVLRSSGGRDSAVAQTAGGKIAGAVLLSSVERTADLIECLRRGNKYRAAVQSIKGALCEVEIRPNA